MFIKNSKFTVFKKCTLCGQSKSNKTPRERTLLSKCNDSSPNLSFNETVVSDNPSKDAFL